MRCLGLDVGSKTIGLAVSDPEGRIAMALDVLRRKGDVADVDAVAELVEGRAIERVVVGMPLELDGRTGHRARRVQRFVERLEQRLVGQRETPVPIICWDERFSTAAAERTLLEADVSRRKRKQKIDAVAAQFILQGWLDAQVDPLTGSQPTEEAP